ncbi:hypothetical protein CFP56_036865 [Quercus suber]|uniref:Neprosin activation peptide domain-containing protein n=1 Tax=Quercus suber TaxID=58331 RepID=A0AAW0LQB9_QUESU
MGKKITLRLLFVIALLVLNNVGVNAEARKFSSEINRKLKLLKKPTIKNGDIIDCVDIYKQPAFDHPALKNHKIEFCLKFGTKVEAVQREPFPFAELGGKNYCGLLPPRALWKGRPADKHNE